MARPRIFVSSTYYDLKHLRSSLENFIESLGFEPVLSEKGDVAYMPDKPLYESCYREVNTADIYVLIIGGRYGSETSRGKRKEAKDFYTRYESITKMEYKSAVEADVPTYVLIEKSVYSDYENFQKNKDNSVYKYAHVDSINIFYFIEDILSQVTNNPIHQFDRFIEIQEWLKEQWAGLFKELLNKMSNQKQLASLTSQVNNLSEINKTLKRYLEDVLSNMGIKNSKNIINEEESRLLEARHNTFVESDRFLEFIHRTFEIPRLDIFSSLSHNDKCKPFIDDIIKNHPETLALSKSYKSHTLFFDKKFLEAKRMYSLYFSKEC